MHPDVLDDLESALARLRTERPVFFYRRLDSWVFSRYDDCLAVLRDSDRFAADWRRVGEELPPWAISVQTLDPPEHTAVRRLLMDALRVQVAPAVEEMIAGQAAALLARLARYSSFDAVTQFAEPLALSSTAGFLGVPAPDLAWLRRLANTVTAGMDAGLWPERGRPVPAAQAELAVLIERWLADPPHEGVLGALVERAVDGGVDPSVLANSVRVLLYPGFSTGSRLIGLSMAALLHGHSGGLERLRAADPVRAVEELIRYTSPTQAVARACVADAEVGGTAVRAGQAVTLLLAAANRDPARFPDPAALWLDRHPNPHLGFGRGPKACLGSWFAATQARVALGMLAERYPAARVLGPPSYRANLTQRSLEVLEVALR